MSLDGTWGRGVVYFPFKTKIVGQVKKVYLFLCPLFFRPSFLTSFLPAFPRFLPPSLSFFGGLKMFRIILCWWVLSFIVTSSVSLMTGSHIDVGKQTRDFPVSMVTGRTTR